MPAIAIPDGRGDRASSTGYGELNAIIGEHGVDLVGGGRDQAHDLQSSRRSKSKKARPRASLERCSSCRQQEVIRPGVSPGVAVALGVKMTRNQWSQAGKVTA